MLWFEDKTVILILEKINSNLRRHGDDLPEGFTEVEW